MDPVHAHLRAYMRAVGGLPGGELWAEGGLLSCRTPIPWPIFNGVMATPELGDCDGIEPMTSSLAAAGRPWFLWVLPDTPEIVLEAGANAGAAPFDEEAPWMEAPISALDVPSIPPGVTVEEVRDEAGHRLRAATLREIYEFPEIGERSWVMPAEMLGWTDLPWRQWIAFADGEPVAVTLLFCGGGVAGLFGVGTRKDMRRRGLGSLVTLLPLKESGEELAGFFATAEGAALYRTLGFESRGWVSRRLAGFPYPQAIEQARGAVGH